MNIENLIHSMLVENTGTHMLDSGGANGRAWQRNQGLTVEDFKNEPEAYINVDSPDDEYPEFGVSLFHRLTSGVLELDDLCNEFNAIVCGAWNGRYYGTDAEMSLFLDSNGFEPVGDAWNSYNWQSALSQDVQGQDLELANGDTYILLQVHGGADARGGYTDAKLFKVNDHCMAFEAIDDSAFFSVEDGAGGYVGLDYMGEWLNGDGGCALDTDFADFHKHSKGQVINGHINRH